MIAAESIQEVRDRAEIVDVVGNFLSLKRRGSNYLANCPFHNEKSPSFNVNPSRGIFKCFGCGKAGDAVTFVQEYEKFSFVEAIRWLAQFYNIDLKETAVSNESKAHRAIEESLRIVFEYAVKYFEHNLRETEEGRLIGLSYFHERGFSDSIISRFQLGYAMDSWDAFYKTGLESGYAESLLVHTGMVSKKNEKLYDTYRGRVIFPIVSNTGKIVGVGARIIGKKENAPKYINSPESEIYNKSRVLYGLYQSKTAISKLDECLLVEGYTDVITLHQYGVENVVSSSGTSLTEGQLKLIKNLTKNLTILYDGDAAGVKAAIRGMQMAVAESYNINIVQLPADEDPDSYIQHHGAAKMRLYIAENKKDIVDFQIDLALQGGALTANAKSVLVNDIAETIALINKSEDFVIQQEYMKKTASRLEIDEHGLIQLVNKLVSENLRKEQKQWIDNQAPRPAAAVQTAPSDADYYQMPMEAFDIEGGVSVGASPAANAMANNALVEWKVLQTLLKYGNKVYDEEANVAVHFFDNFEVDAIENELCKKIVKEYETVMRQDSDMDRLVLHFIRHQDSTIKNKVIELLMDHEVPNPKWESEFGIATIAPEDNYLEESKSVFAYFELEILGRLIQEVLSEIKEKNQPTQVVLELMQVHKDLKEKEKSLLSLVVKR